MNNILDSKDSANKFIDDDFDLWKIFSFLSRNRKSIIIITCLGIVFGLGDPFFRKSIYNGSFQILVIDEAENNFKNNKTLSSLNQITDIGLGLGSMGSNTKTQEFILRSPSVLMPVYEYSKENYKKRGEKISDLTFKKWMKDYLDINFEDKTTVLSINFKDNNKEFILDILNKISDKYKQYSRRDRIKKINNTILYLEDQKKILKNNAIKSLKDLNSFSIENGLGDIDGFVSLGLNKSNQKKFQKNPLFNQFDDDIKLKNEKAGQRFSSQFSLLENYESQYTDYSSRLKSDASIMKDLKNKIENLRSELKRPNEILVKYRELIKISERDESLLNNIEDELAIYLIEKAKQQDPWELISQPTVDNIKMWPKRKLILFIYLISTFILSVLFSFIREYRNGKIYDFNKIRYLVKPDFLDSLFEKDKFLSNEIFRKKLEEILEINYKDITKNKIAIVNTSTRLSKKNQSLLEYLSLKNKIKILNIDNFEKINEFNKIIYVFDEIDVTKKDINLVNKYFKILPHKTIGWFYCDREN
tara:strand:- start:5606 stop:7198 length:1593 start_codon:yes stop_codon:yes gene_type:complete